MKISTKLLLTVASLALVAAPSVPAAGNNQEVSVGGLVFLPQDGLFSTGAGGVANYRYWFSPDWAVTATLGATHVGVKNDRTEVAPGTSGSFDLVPLGADLTCNVVDIQPFRLNVNLGLRYEFISSSATCLNVAGKEMDMTLDDVVLVQVGLDADWALAQHWAIFAAANFAQDMSKNRLQTADGPLRPTDMSGFNLELGVRANF
jgi:hypothetical protein